ncbi:response regulator transcription factor [Tomitella cavernea]|uniref:response regulator transcription factor n=1 Tax=Tomitella cavernea TaxID=1387982 RepID=UPI0027DE58FB|nr:LuxR C-terminal-related transcriptional regulator [Tomitella cavernea]
MRTPERGRHTPGDGTEPDGTRARGGGTAAPGRGAATIFRPDAPPAQARVYAQPTLSHREIEVLRCWLLSDSKTEVSGKLHVAPGTIKSHLHRIRGKYEAVGRNAGTKASLVARALQDGILTLEEL